MASAAIGGCIADSQAFTADGLITLIGILTFVWAHLEPTNVGSGDTPTICFSGVLGFGAIGSPIWRSFSSAVIEVGTMDGIVVFPLAINVVAALIISIFLQSNYPMVRSALVCLQLLNIGATTKAVSR